MGKVVPINIPPGAHRNGTEYQSKGRWRDVNPVRWHEGSMKPHTGWSAHSGISDGFVSTGTSDIPSDADVRNCMAWVDNSSNAYLIWADSGGETHVMEEDGTIT